MSVLAPGLSPAARKLRLMRTWARGRPVWCSWQITPRCGGLCHLCEHRSEGGVLDPSLDTCLRVVSALSEVGSLLVSLTGGEPFLRADLADIVAAVARHHFPHLTTHGWLVTPEAARAVWAAGLEGASVLLHDAGAEPHDALAGTAGAHKRAVTALQVFLTERTRRSQQVNIKLRLAEARLDTLEGVLRLAEDLGVSVSVEPSFPLPGQAPPEGWGQQVRELKRRHPSLRSGSDFLSRFESAWRTGVPGCQAGRAFLNVDHRGRVSRCIEFSGEQETLADLSRESLIPALSRLRALPGSNSCQACWYASRGEVEGLYTLRGLLRALPTLIRA